jgi:hypothetical protein
MTSCPSPTNILTSETIPAHVPLHFTTPLKMTGNEEQPQQLINGELKPLSGMEATGNIPVIKSKAEYLKAVMYEGVRFSRNFCIPPPLHPH